MDNGLEEMYQEIILDHNKRPRNFGKLEDACCSADGHNPLCGDELTVYIKLRDKDIIDSISFEGQGCAISKASASLMTQRVKGMHLDDVKKAIEQVQSMLTSEEEGVIDLDQMGDLAALSGVRQFHARIKCATLAWHALGSALAGESKASTE